MKEQVDKIFKSEKEFDRVVEEIFEVAEKEEDPKKRRAKIAELIAEVKKAFIGAHYDAITDFLTGCFNKKHIKELYHHQFASAKRNKEYFSLGVMDIDYLKHINDTYGHSTGDQVIKQIAKGIMRVIRENDLIFRYGGDEFVVFCTHNEKNGMKIVIGRINKELAGLNLIKDFKPSISIGAVTYEPAESGNLSYTQVFKEADEKLYEAKRSRKTPDFLVKKHE
jgi:diguanylate cyclase (GGDEF)-like protein